MNDALELWHFCCHRYDIDIITNKMSHQQQSPSATKNRQLSIIKLSSSVCHFVGAVYQPIRGRCNIGYLSKFISNSNLENSRLPTTYCPVVNSFIYLFFLHRTWHRYYRTSPKFQNGWATEWDIIDDSEFVRFEFKMTFGGVCYIATVLGLQPETYRQIFTRRKYNVCCINGHAIKRERKLSDCFSFVKLCPAEFVLRAINCSVWN